MFSIAILIDQRFFKKVQMKYSFRRGALTGDERIETTDRLVKLFKGKGKARREIAFADIQKIYGFSNMSAWDEDGGTFETHITQLTPKKGRGIRICSSSYIRNGTNHRQVAKNNAEKYIKVLDEIKCRVSEANPDAMLVSGNIVASVMGYVCSLAGLAMIGLCVADVFYGPKPLSRTWPLLLVGMLIGLIFIPWGFQLAKAYATTKQNLRTVQSRPQTTAPGDHYENASKNS